MKLLIVSSFEILPQRDLDSTLQYRLSLQYIMCHYCYLRVLLKSQEHFDFNCFCLDVSHAARKLARFAAREKFLWSDRLYKKMCNNSAKYNPV